MLDPKLIRETPDLVRAAIAKKHLDVDLDAVLALDAAWRNLLQEVELLRSKQKAANIEMAKLPFCLNRFRLGDGAAHLHIFPVGPP